MMIYTVITMKYVWNTSIHHGSKWILFEFFQDYSGYSTENKIIKKILIYFSLKQE